MDKLLKIEKLGNKLKCNCGVKYYDLGSSNPICPECQTFYKQINQRINKKISPKTINDPAHDPAHDPALDLQNNAPNQNANVELIIDDTELIIDDADFLDNDKDKKNPN